LSLYGVTGQGSDGAARREKDGALVGPRGGGGPGQRRRSSTSVGRRPMSLSASVQLRLEMTEEEEAMASASGSALSSEKDSLHSRANLRRLSFEQGDSPRSARVKDLSAFVAETGKGPAAIAAGNGTRVESAVQDVNARSLSTSPETVKTEGRRRPSDAEKKLELVEVEPLPTDSVMRLENEKLRKEVMCLYS